MNKLELIDALKRECSISKNEAATIVVLFFDKMSAALAEGDRVEIRGLCSFFVKEYKSYQGRNFAKSLLLFMPSCHSFVLFLIHGVDLFEELLPYKNSVLWTERVKSEGRIRFFGFSTHTNMERNLMVASKFGWIDGIMFSYNFRNMHSKKMKNAVDACSKAGIGLIAMKTQASGQDRIINRFFVDHASGEYSSENQRSDLTQPPPNSCRIFSLPL